jgi:hypothetical protein
MVDGLAVKLAEVQPASFIINTKPGCPVASLGKSEERNDESNAELELLRHVS